MKVSKREEVKSLMLSEEIRGLQRSAPLILTASVGSGDKVRSRSDTIKKFFSRVLLNVLFRASVWLKTGGMSSILLSEAGFVSGWSGLSLKLDRDFFLGVLMVFGMVPIDVWPPRARSDVWS